MIEKRVEYGIRHFLEGGFFLEQDQFYCLEEKAESGRSELQLEVNGDNLCSEDYDHKGKCNFLRDGEFKLKRSVDHVVLQKKDEKWILHLIEMKSKVDNKKWYEIKQKIRASYFNMKALESVLGIHIDEIKTYTTYEDTWFSRPSGSADPKMFAAPLGKPTLPTPQMDWDGGQITVDIGEIVQFPHLAVLMKRTEDGEKLVGKLSIS